jgi:hypothetical protein
VPLHVIGVVATLAAMIFAAAVQAAFFSFAGITLDSNLDEIARQYPHSQRAGEFIYLAAQDSRDHMSGIELSGAGPTRRVRVSFETRGAGARPKPDYPACADLQRTLERQFGPPGAIRTFSEESSQRADRYWQHDSESLTLLCFKGPDGRLLAEAVQINRLGAPKQ